QRFNPRIRARSAKSHCCSEGESGENNWLTKLPLQPIERGADVVQFASPVIVLPFAQARASKIKPQHGKAKAVEGFHGAEHDLVVQCASVHRMRMTHQCGMAGVFRTHVEESFEATSRPVQKERSYGRVQGRHGNRL